MQRNSKPIAWRPRGCSDTLDSSETFPGAMAALTNLIPDPSTPLLFQSRPAATRNTSFGGFSSPGFVSICKVIGQYAYGMVATSTNPGRDQPFAYNLTTNSFTAITGVTANNVPASPSTTGAWTPPQMALIGSKLVVTHPGFSGAFGAFFGYFDIADPTAPTWAGGNCQGTGFPTFLVPPSGVAQFNGRAYFIHNLPAQPAVIFSDILDPLTNSAGSVTPVITFDDNVPLTAIGGLPLSSPITGGIIQAIMVFKGSSNIYQITGDSALNTLAKNALNIPTGTQAPMTVVPTPKGLAFVSPQGLRIIDFSANVSDPIGQDGKGIVLPFLYSNVPSRMVAGCNGTIIRITTQNAFVPGTPWQEWWFDFTRNGTWTGPHSFPANNMQPYGNTFIMTPVGVTGSLWTSDYVQSNTSTFVENSVQMTWAYATAFLPDTDEMTLNAMTMTTLDLALTAGMSAITIQAQEQNGIIFDTVSITSPGTAPLWGTAIWGQFVWGGTQSALAPRQLPWHKPIDFARLQIVARGSSVAGFKIGALHLRYKILRFFIDPAAATPRQFTLDSSVLGGPDVLG